MSLCLLWLPAAQLAPTDPEAPLGGGSAVPTTPASVAGGAAEESKKHVRLGRFVVRGRAAPEGERAAHGARAAQHELEGLRRAAEDVARYGATCAAEAADEALAPCALQLEVLEQLKLQLKLQNEQLREEGQLLQGLVARLRAGGAVTI